MGKAKYEYRGIEVDVWQAGKKVGRAIERVRIVGTLGSYRWVQWGSKQIPSTVHDGILLPDPGPKKRV